MTGKRIQKSVLIFVVFLIIVFLTLPAALNAAGIAGSAEPPVYSLEDFYRLVLKRSESIKIAQNQLGVAEQDVDRAFSVLLPNFSAYGDYIRYENDSLIQPKSGREIGVKLQQQFTVNGRELIILGAAKDTVKQREYDLDAVTEENLFTVATVYYDIVNNQKRLEIAKENVIRLKAHKEAVVTRLKLEDVPKTALLRTEAELSGARSDLVQAKNALALTYANLSRMLEIPMDYDVVVPDLEENFPIDHGMEKYIETAHDRRPDIKSLEMAVNLAQDNVDIMKSEYWPTLSLEAGFNRQDTDPPFTDEKENLYGAVSLNVLLFDWGYRSSTISQEKLRHENAKHQLRAKSKEVALAVERAFRTIVSAQSTIAALKDKLRFSRADYEAVSLQFEVGQADILDVLDSNTVLLNSERELSEARFMLAIARVGLEKAQGIFLKSVRRQLNGEDVSPTGDKHE